LSRVVQQPYSGLGNLLVEDWRSHTFGHTTLGRTPLDGWSPRRIVLFLRTHSTQKTQTSMPPEGFEPAIPASEGPKTAQPMGSAI